MAAAHVPAWKRLGLELVNDSAPEHDVAPVPKKRKIEKAQLLPSESLSNGLDGLPSDRRVSHQAQVTVPSEQRKNKRKKSVNNAASGEPSIAQASEKQSEDQIDEQGEEQPKEQSEMEIEEQGEEESEASKEAKRQRKREARETRRKKESESHPKDNEPRISAEDKMPSSKAYLKYLYLYHADQTQWKFNKSTQSSLLKDCFNLYRVPPEYGPALMQYISGLQGHAARVRLAADAKTTIEEVEKTVANGFTSLKAMDPMNLSQKHLYIPPPPGLSPKKVKEWEDFMEWKRCIYEEWNAKEAAIAADPAKAMIEYSNRRDFVGYIKRQKMLGDEARKETIDYKFEMLKKCRGEEILNAVKIMMDAMVTQEREKKQQAVIASGRPPKPQNDPLAPKIINKPKKSRGRKRRTAAADESSSESSSDSDDD